MKKVSIASLLLLILAACAPGRIDTCENLSRGLSKPLGWSDKCVLDESVYRSGFVEYAHVAPKEELCLAEYSQTMPWEQSVLRGVISKKNLNCKPVVTRAKQNLVSSYSIADLCYLWGAPSGGEKEITSMINKEVKRRGVNCALVMAAQAQQAQADAQMLQALQASRLADSIEAQTNQLRYNALQANHNRSVRVEPFTCTSSSSGKYLNCY